MEANVETAVEMNVESIRMRMNGPLTLSRAGVPLELPPSRKVRALLAYLALSPRPVARSTLCELLWEIPNDPRGELRWCLSKIRRVVGAERLVTRDDTVALDTRGWILEIDGEGELLEGLDVDRSPAYQAWLTAQRRSARERRLKALEQRAHTDDMAALEAWLQEAPFDRRAHEKLLTVLARRGWIEEGKAHVAAACKRFVDEGLDCSFLRDAWRAAKGMRYNDLGIA
jgi:DNA-binding SARP family transcriptional activator